MSEENKAIVRRYWEEGFNKGDLSVMDEVISPDFVRTTTGGRIVRGIENAKHSITSERASFPDLQVTIEDQIAEGDKVVSQVTWRGTQQGEFRGIPATGKEVTIPIVSIHRVVGGKISDVLIKWDRMGVMEQLGVTRT